MSKKGSAAQRRNAPRKRRDPSTKGDRRRSSAARRQAAGSKDDGSWFATKLIVLRFVVMLGLLMGAFNAIFYLWIAKSGFFERYLDLNAEVSAAVLRLFGDEATAAGKSISSPAFSLSVEAGCDALQASAFFVFAVVVFPSAVSLLSRLRPLLLGILVLLALNLVRIVSLYYTGVYFPDAFESMHIDVWQTLFIFFPLVFWLLWVRSALRAREVSPDAAS